MSTSRTTTTWLSACGVLLKVEPVDPDGPQLIEQWWPLHRVARTAAAAGMPPVIHLDEFRVVGIVRRSCAGLLWIYLHRQSEREIFVSEAGQTFGLTPFRNDRTRGRFDPCPVELAIHTASLATLIEIHEHLRTQPQPQRRRVRDFGLHIDGPRCYDVSEALMPFADAPSRLEVSPPPTPTVPFDPNPNQPVTRIQVPSARRRPRPPVGPRPRASAPRQPRPAGPLRLVWPVKGPSADPLNLN